MFKKALTAAALGTMLAASPAIAAEGTGPSVVIKHRDLNLATAEGQDALQHRIDAAARKVCGVGEHETGTRIPSAEAKTCYVKARAKAQSQMALIVAGSQRGG